MDENERIVEERTITKEGNMQELLERHCERKQELFNESFRRLWGATQLSAEECKEVLKVINERLPGNDIAHHLRKSLCLALDVIATEDAIVKSNRTKG